MVAGDKLGVLHKTKVEIFCCERGIDLVGIADLQLLKGIYTYPKNLLERFDYGISLAISIRQYEFDEERARHKLSWGALSLQEFINEEGYKAQVVPTHKTVGNAKLMGAISHKAIAKTAGLGWIGKNLLLVTPQFGPRVNLMTVLTTLPLKADEPLTSRCGNCKACCEVCPVGAIKGALFKDHPSRREDALDVDRCAQAEGNECSGQVCMKACPVGD